MAKIDPHVIALLIAGIVVIAAWTLIRKTRRSRIIARRAQERRARLLKREGRFRTPAYTRIQTLAQAATESDEELQRRLTTIDINARTPDGDSALHLAYHDDRKEAVQRLQRYGADATLRNNDRLTPAEMTYIADTERLLKATTACMSRCIWINEATGRPLYDKLRDTPPSRYNPALVRFFLRTPNQRRLLCLAVKVGMPGSEDRLALILHGYGDREMATDYLNCGSEQLVSAAQQWAATHGYIINYRAGHGGAHWGEF